jgi:hypothetical protein
MEIFKTNNEIISTMFKSVFLSLTQSIVTNLVIKKLLPSILCLYTKFNFIKISLQIKVLVTLLVSGIILCILYKIYKYFFCNKKHRHSHNHSHQKKKSSELSSFSTNSNDFELDPKKVKNNLKKKNKKLSYESLLSSD